MPGVARRIRTFSRLRPRPTRRGCRPSRPGPPPRWQWPRHSPLGKRRTKPMPQRSKRNRRLMAHSPRRAVPRPTSAQTAASSAEQAKDDAHAADERAQEAEKEPGPQRTRLSQEASEANRSMLGVDDRSGRTWPLQSYWTFVLALAAGWVCALDVSRRLGDKARRFAGPPS